MAQYNADIVLSVKNQASLDRVAATLDRVNALAKELKPINLFAPGKGTGADELNIAMRKIEQRAAAIAKYGSVQISATYAGAAQTADAFAEVLRNVDIEAKKGIVSIDEQSERVKNLAFAYAEAEKKAETLGARYESLIQQARQAKGLAIGPVSELGTVEADSAAAAARAEAAQTEAATRAQATYQAQINKNLRTDVLYQRLKLDLILDQSDALLKQDSLMARLAKKAAQSGGAGKFGENLALGVGFPLLFGGGAGSIAGSAIGSFFGTGFGGQILGGALGQTLDQALIKIRDIGNAAKELNFDKLVESGIRINTQTQQQLDLLLQVGDALTAQQLVSQEIARETGTLTGVTEDVTNSVNILNDSWRKTVNAVSTTAGIIAAPLAVALAGVLEVVNAIFRAINTIFSLLGTGLKTVVEFGIELVGGKQAVEFINAGIDRLNSGLSAATAQAAELRNTLNQSVVRSSIELQATKALTPGLTSEDKITNIRVQNQKDLDLLFQDEIDARVKIRKENAKASAETVEALIKQNDLLYKNRRESMNINAERQITAEIQRNQTALQQKQAELERKAAQELEKQRKELERIAKLRTEQLDAAQRKFVLAEADIAILTSETEQSKIQAEYDKVRIERMYTYTDLIKNARSEEERQAIVATQFLDILAAQIKQERAISDELDNQVEKYKEIDSVRRTAFAGYKDVEVAALQELTSKAELVKITFDSIGQSFSNSVTQVVTGATTIQQAVADMFAAIGKALIDYATQAIATYIALGAARIFAGISGVQQANYTGNEMGGIFNNPSFGIDSSGLAGPSNPLSQLNYAGVRFATGGFVTGPTRAIVGEGGEPEYVIPSSKMAGAMSRYAAGARGSSVIPQNGDSAMAGGGGGGTFTLETVVINNVEYATVDQVRAMGQQAATQGAEGGFNRSMRTLQNSRSQRARIGLR